MIIRQLAPADAQAYKRIRLQALRENPEAFSSSWEEESAFTDQEWEERLDTSRPLERCMFGAFDGDDCVGIIGYFRQARNKLRHKGMIVSVYVQPACRGRGLARRLLQEMLAHIKQSDGLEQVQLSVVSSNTAAISLYQSHGFIAFGEEKRALKIGEAAYDELYMALYL